MTRANVHVARDAALRGHVAQVLPQLTLYDLHALGYVLLELIISSLAEPGARPVDLQARPYLVWR